jgi:hypothetical protein
MDMVSINALGWVKKSLSSSLSSGSRGFAHAKYCVLQPKSPIREKLQFASDARKKLRYEASVPLAHARLHSSLLTAYSVQVFNIEMLVRCW